MNKQLFCCVIRFRRRLPNKTETREWTDKGRTPPKGLGFESGLFIGTSEVDQKPTIIDMNGKRVSTVYEWIPHFYEGTLVYREEQTS